MAKRRKLEAPSAADLSRLEAELDAARGPAKAAPIAQIAGEAAVGVDPRAPADREAAATLAHAEAEGLLLRQIPLDEIEADALVRDRLVLDADEMEELKGSILKNGLRLPIEVFDRGAGQGYGLLSGYRRLMAVRDLREATDLPQFATIRAILRDPEALGGSFAAMVEENEVRAQLSHFERGRIAVIAAQQGAFANTEAAVEALFPVASKAKRSKIRSFALIFEELGDMLQFPDLLRERDGLRLASALRDGHDEALRDFLAGQRPETPAQEVEVLEAALASLGPSAPAEGIRKGRPRKSAQAHGVRAAGLDVTAERHGRDVVIHVRGAELDGALIDSLVAEIHSLLKRR
ncbi:chromosome partitioning protein ParB [Jannaschia pagri]|uniref:Chromosome partitioning protein ParB n=1 Tax=Jannaschia pagri TaxID=2829797 RepID=A0ABQ4NRJ3_9RHOB|nr:MULTISPECIES: ParB N-terminal domain-containing protein [unclassified Jannaschia]GIT93226.1 chromosome partitioning protein ParB [Jannaschia sp. AI_61]GIT97007.1 chromosome partitioning protein ParB [Jannaschia sp. AI_62]